MSQFHFPQYAKTTHPEVVQAIKSSEVLYKDFLKRVRAFCEELTGDPNTGMLHGWRNDKVWMTGLNPAEVDAANLPGKWKKPTGGTLQPFKSNPVSEQINTLKYQHEKVPGRPLLFMGSGRMGTGSMFIHDGTAYSGLGFTPLSDCVDPREGGWEEIRASELHAAMEAENERRNQEAQ